MAKSQKSRVEKPIPKKETKQYATGNVRLLLTAAGIALFTFFCLSAVLQNGFTNWDDNAYVFENKKLDLSLGDAVAYFFQLHFFIGNYHPLTMLVYALEYKYAGLQASFFHGVNLFIHAVNVMLVFWLTWLLSKRKLFVAVFVALFFGIHPMHVESVAWIAELKDVLYSSFFLAGLIMYHYYSDSSKKTAGSQIQRNVRLKYLLWAFLLFILSMLSKPAAVTFPIVLLLMDFYAERKSDRVMWLEKIPFFIVSVTFGIIAIKAQASDHLLHDYYPFSERALFACSSLLLYIIKLFVPYRLSIYYPYPVPGNEHMPVVYYLAPLVVAGLLYLVYKTLRQTRLVAFGFLFFLVNILLVLQLISVGDAVMAERYTYIPYIGLLFVIGLYAEHLYMRANEKMKAYKPAMAGLVIVLAAVFSYTSYARCAVWQNDVTIAIDLVAKYPNDRLALNNMGFIDYNMGKKQEAMEYYKKALAQKPDYTMASINLANAYISFSDYENAMKCLDEALLYVPRNNDILTTKGYLMMMAKQYPQAITLEKEAIEVKKSNASSYVILGQCYWAMQQYDSSMEALDIALNYDSTNIYALNDKGYFLFLEKRYTEAIPYFKKALEVAPGYQTAGVNLSECYKAMNDTIAQKR